MSLPDKLTVSSLSDKLTKPLQVLLLPLVLMLVHFLGVKTICFGMDSLGVDAGSASRPFGLRRGHLRVVPAPPRFCFSFVLFNTLKNATKMVSFETFMPFNFYVALLVDINLCGGATT